MKESALLFAIHRLSTDDGPGLRNTFFLKGCALRCTWCHNPESISPQPEIWWTERKCIGARDCIAVCPEEALTLTPQGLAIDRERCTGCGKCIEPCPSKALELIGKPWTVEQLLREACKERLFFKNSGGGVTLSGGEPCLQPGFVTAFFKACQAEGLHTALDTCGFPPWRNFEQVLPHTDLVLYDLKEINPERHQRFTGVPNESILENLLRIRDFRNEQGGHPALWIRTPLIPGYTATAENITSIGRFLAENLGDRMERWELCAFNNLCGAKYARLGRKWPLEDQPLLEPALGTLLLEKARQALGRPDAVQITGLV